MCMLTGIKKSFIVFLVVLVALITPVYAASCTSCAFTGSKSMTVPEGRSAGWTAKHGCASKIKIACTLKNGTMYISGGNVDTSSFNRNYNGTVVVGSIIGKTNGSYYSITSNKCNPCSHGCTDCTD